jgi:uncharacterized protein DUF4136
MKSIRNLFTCGVFLVLCAGAAFAQNVQTDYDRNFNLGKLRTYGFIEQTRRPGDPLAASPINDRRIHDALNSQLGANGLSSSNQPDFWIAYSVTTRKGLDIQDNRFGIWQRMGSVNVNQTTEGTLVVAFFDAATNQEVWRGYAAGTLNPKNFDKDVNKACAKLIQKFKKNQLGQK